MKRRNVREGMKQLLVVSFLICFLTGFGMPANPVAGAMTIGQTYDKSNVDEIKDMLPPSIYKWVKNGDWTIPTGKLAFECKWGDKYIALSRQNEGKYAIDGNGLLILKATGKPPDYYAGDPFPMIDPSDPKIADKIMANFKAFMHAGGGAFYYGSGFSWVGTKGLERRIAIHNQFLYYNNRESGPIPNPNKYLMQRLFLVVLPFEFKGTGQMIFSYADARPDTIHAYVPALRRIRRTADTANSDPFLGCDITLEDDWTWAGKNASMNWKLVGGGTYLMPMTSAEKHMVKRVANGAIECFYPPLKMGYEDSGWKGVPWAVTNYVWAPRPVWIVEGTAKDPNYIYDKQTMYVDKDTYVAYMKETTDKSGGYWKTIILGYSPQQTEDGRVIFCYNSGVGIDDQKQHATIGPIEAPQGIKANYNMPVHLMGPQNFNESTLQQISK